jgi:hypothetical protein
MLGRAMAALAAPGTRAYAASKVTAGKGFEALLTSEEHAEFSAIRLKVVA